MALSWTIPRQWGERKRRRGMEEEERGLVPVCDFFLRMFRSWVSCPEERRESQGAGRGQRPLEKGRFQWTNELIFWGDNSGRVVGRGRRLEGSVVDRRELVTQVNKELQHS
jgi:hypothetical protein